MTSILRTALVVLGLASIAGLAPAKPRLAQTLTQYLAANPWDAARSGPLIAIDPDRVVRDDEDPAGLPGFERRIAKVGQLNVIIPLQTVTLDESNLPSAYDRLSPDEKIRFLLATMTDAERRQLNSQGISPNDLQGQQRAALLSIIPTPFRFVRGTSSGNGFGSTESPIELKPEEVAAVRLQVFKGVSVTYGLTKDGQGGMGARGASSIDYRGPAGTPCAMADFRMAARHRERELPGKIVPSFEKRGDLNWSDSRLAKPVSLTAKPTIGEIVDSVRQATGVEVYADARVARLATACVGDSATAADLLRGLCFALGGTVRRVGPAYVLTSDLEGENTRETRLQAADVMARDAIAPKLAEWKSALERNHAIEQLGFLADDPLHADRIPKNLIVDDSAKFEEGWVPLSMLNQAFSDLVNPPQSNQRGGINISHPDPAFQDKVQLKYEIGWRFVLPDGTPLDGHHLEREGAVGRVTVINNGSEPPPVQLPIAVSALPKGSSVGLESNDPAWIAKTCAALAGYGIKELWLETGDKQTLAAAVKSGLKVSLIVRPWKALPSETCPDPDRNVTGMTGDQLDKIPEAKITMREDVVNRFCKSYGPGDPALDGHWKRLLDLASSPGVSRVVLLQVQPLGYHLGASGGNVIFGGGGADRLEDRIPALFDYGYSTQMRLGFLRQSKVDPIDFLPTHNGNLLCPPAPYFDDAMFRGRPGAGEFRYPRVPRRDMDGPIHEWAVFRSGKNRSELEPFLEQLAGKGHEIYLPIRVPERPFGRIEAGVFAWKGGGSPWPEDDPPAENAIWIMRLSSLNAEDSDGALTYKMRFMPSQATCFDLSDVPAGRVQAYLKYLFKPSR